MPRTELVKSKCIYNESVDISTNTLTINPTIISDGIYVDVDLSRRLLIEIINTDSSAMELTVVGQPIAGDSIELSIPATSTGAFMFETAGFTIQEGANKGQMWIDVGTGAVGSFRAVETLK